MNGHFVQLIANSVRLERKDAERQHRCERPRGPYPRFEALRAAKLTDPASAPILRAAEDDQRPPAQEAAQLEPDGRTLWL